MYTGTVPSFQTLDRANLRPLLSEGGKRKAHTQKNSAPWTGLVLYFALARASHPLRGSLPHQHVAQALGNCQGLQPGRAYLWGHRQAASPPQLL